MHTIRVRNVHEALPLGISQIVHHGEIEDSRNGEVMVFPTPVSTEYTHPMERVMFHAARDCNPFFHLFESLWMLAGRNDVASVAHYVKRMATFSDNGRTFHAAYGHRWRRHFKFDQVAEIIKLLGNNPKDRRCVLQMWDAKVDLGKEGKDFPCNTIATFRVNPVGALDMTVFNRSNDMIWGAYGANAVHFSFLQEYIAAAIGRSVGSYYQVSTNFHAYTQVLKPLLAVALEDSWSQNPYVLGEVAPFPIIDAVHGETQAMFDLDLGTYMLHGCIVGFSTKFFRQVVTPMHYAHEAYKSVSNVDRFVEAREILDQCQASDWRRAAMEWINRREAHAQRQR